MTVWTCVGNQLEAVPHSHTRARPEAVLDTYARAGNRDDEAEVSTAYKDIREIESRGRKMRAGQILQLTPLPGL